MSCVYTCWTKGIFTLGIVLSNEEAKRGGVGRSWSRPGCGIKIAIRTSKQEQKSIVSIFGTMVITVLLSLHWQNISFVAGTKRGRYWARGIQQGVWFITKEMLCELFFTTNAIMGATAWCGHKHKRGVGTREGLDLQQFQNSLERWLMLRCNELPGHRSCAKVK